ncbi:hypothetical protein AGMMS49957_01420 [Synergistales bacterium]|nr:hypothetical protein AGMMS49957_01420 [Synergistales bacterium]
MAMVVNHNIPALVTYNTINRTSSAIERSIQKLSTGLRINSAADDAAGLAISEKMRAQIQGLDRAVSNSQDGISMIQTAEGALSETHSILQRMRELSVQAANDTLTQQDRGYIQLEIDQLREEITRIGNTTQFNKKKLLDGSAAALWSADKLSTSAIINGGLRTIDQFGQKVTTEGNFVIDINAIPGKAQVQKSDIFTIKHADVVMNVSTNGQAGINGVSVNNVPAGDYVVGLSDVTATASNPLAGLTATFENYSDGEYDVTLTVNNIDTVTGAVEFVISYNETSAPSVGAGAAQDGPDIGSFWVSTKTKASAEVLYVSTAGSAGAKATDAYSPLNVTLDLSGVDVTALTAGAAGTGDEITFKVGKGNITAGDPVWSTSAPTTGNNNVEFDGVKLTPGDKTSPVPLSGGAINIAATNVVNGVGDYHVEGDFGNGTEGFDVNVDATGIGTFTSSTGVTWSLDFSGVTTIANIQSGDDATVTVTAALASSVSGTPLAVGAGTALATGTVAKASSNNIALQGNASIIWNNAVDFSAYAAGDNVEVHFTNLTINGVDYGSFSKTGSMSATGQLTVILDDPNATPITFDVTFADNTGDIVAGTHIDFNFTGPKTGSIGTGTPAAIGITTTLDAVGRYGANDAAIGIDGSGAKKNASILLEVTAVNDTTKAVSFKATSNILDTDGKVLTRVQNITLNENVLDISSLIDGNAGELIAALTGTGTGLVSTDFKLGDKLAYNVVATGTGSDLVNFNISGKQTADWKDGWKSTLTGGANPTTNNSVTYKDAALSYTLDKSEVKGQDVHFKNFYINEENGDVYTGDIVLNLGKDFDTRITNFDTGNTLASFTAAYIGQVAEGDVILRDLDKFWNSEGRFLLKDAQTLTITQGDGVNTKVTLYATDTLNDVKTKLNDAIAKQIGQQANLSIDPTTDDPSANKFVSFVGSEDRQDGTSESVNGTFVVRSAIAGVAGEISFAGDEDVIKAFSLNEIQASFENSFNVSVWDAHSGKV